MGSRKFLSIVYCIIRFVCYFIVQFDVALNGSRVACTYIRIISFFFHLGNDSSLSSKLVSSKNFGTPMSSVSNGGRVWMNKERLHTHTLAKSAYTCVYNTIYNAVRLPQDVYRRWSQSRYLQIYIRKKEYIYIGNPDAHMTLSVCHSRSRSTRLKIPPHSAG